LFKKIITYILNINYYYIRKPGNTSKIVTPSDGFEKCDWCQFDTDDHRHFDGVVPHKSGELALYCVVWCCVMLSVYNII